jgi:membrane-associated phospholipid phosphatase
VRSAEPAPVLLPPRLRKGLLSAVLLAVGALVALSADVAGKGDETRLDHVLWEPRAPGWLVDRDVLRGAALLLPVTAPFAAAVLAAWCWRRGLHRAAVLAVGGPLAAVGVTEALKPLLGRPPQYGSGWMFPSGHVTVVAAVSAVGAVLLLAPDGIWTRRSAPWLTVAWVLVLAPPALASTGTVTEHYHYPTDVVGALLVAAASVVLVAAVVDLFGSLASHRGRRCRPGLVSAR